MADETTEPVQPDVEGQGGGGTEGSAPYADYLDRIPEELRGDVEPVFRDWDKNVTQRFQEAAQYRDQWQPYEQYRDHLGSPEDLAGLLQFRDALQNDPQAIRDWYEQTYAPQFGLTQQQQEQAAGQDPVDFFAGDKEQIDQLLSERLTPLQSQVEQLAQHYQQQQAQQVLDEAHQFIDGQLSDLEQKHPDAFKIDGAKDIIADIANRYSQDDPENAIPRAFDDFQKWIGAVQTATLQQKASDPEPALSGGGVDVTPDQPRNFVDARPMAREIIRNINNAS